MRDSTHDRHDRRETAENAKDREDSENLEVEINQLPLGSLGGAAFGRSGDRRWRRVMVAAMLTLVVLLTLVLAEHGASSPSQPVFRSPPASTVGTGTTAPLPFPFETPPEQALAPAPARCPAAVGVLEQISNMGQSSQTVYTGALAYGASPVWLVGLQPEQNRLLIHFEVFPTFPPLPYTAHGWRWRILVVSAPPYKGSVTLSSEQTGGGAVSPLWIDAGTGLVTRVSLNALHPPLRGVGWAEWPIYVYLSEPGCYELDAHWAGGSWRIGFAAGR